MSLLAMPGLQLGIHRRWDVVLLPLASVASLLGAALAGASIALLAVLLVAVVAPDRTSSSLLHGAVTCGVLLLLIPATVAVTAFYTGHSPLGRRTAAAAVESFAVALLGISFAWIFGMLPFLFASLFQPDLEKPLLINSSLAAIFCGLGGCFGCFMAALLRQHLDYECKIHVLMSRLADY